MKKIRLLPLILALALTGCASIHGEHGEGNGNETPTPSVTISLSSIAITARPTKVEYDLGEQFNSAGLVVTATYSDGSTKDVTASVTLGSVDTSTVGVKSVSVSYTENGVTKTTSFSITVKVPPVVPDEEPEDLDDYGYNHYNGYYGQLTWTNAQDLVTKLHNIISKDVNYLRYESSSSAPANWETNTDADHAYDDLEMLDVVYSKDDVKATETNSGWQREHAFVASLMTGVTTTAAVGAKQGRAVDFHNLFAASRTGNTSRSDKNFGVVDDPTSQGYQKIEGNYTSNNKLFEPSDEDKGKLARAIMYMCVMYNTDEEEDISLTLNYNDEDKATYGQNSKTVHIPMVYKPLSITEGLSENSLVDFTKYHYATTEDIQNYVAAYGADEDGYAAYVRDNAKYSIGTAAAIVEWANRKVDIQEYQHNQSVYSHVHSNYGIAQNNRNPFVDYPGLVDYLFGSKTNEAGDLRTLKPTAYSLNLEQDGVHHYAIKTATREFEVGQTFSKDSYQLVGIKTDFSQVNVDSSIDSTQSYTFTQSDIGEKTMYITTSKNIIELKVKVKATSASYSYKYVYDGDKTDFGSGDFEAGTARTITLNGENWSATAQHVANLANKTNPLSIQIGNGTTKCAEKFTLVSARSFSNVNRMQIIANTAANKTCTVTIKIGSTTVSTYSITGSSTEMTTKEITIDPSVSGVITIEFSNLPGALYLSTIAINENK